jgi:hypothetical protein
MTRARILAAVTILAYLWLVVILSHTVRAEAPVPRCY